MPESENSNSSRRRFESLIAPVMGMAYGTVLRMTRNQEEAEDLVQDAAMQAFSAFHSFQEGTNFKAWFFRIMINRFRYNYRKRKREPEIAYLDDAPDLYLYAQTSEAGLMARSEDPATILIDRMSEEQIETALGALPEEFRIVAALYFIEELPYQEIADIVGCPVGTVRSRLHRGRKLLQKSLWMVAQDRGVVGRLCAEGMEV